MSAHTTEVAGTSPSLLTGLIPVHGRGPDKQHRHATEHHEDVDVTDVVSLVHLAQQPTRRGRIGPCVYS